LDATLSLKEYITLVLKQLLKSLYVKGLLKIRKEKYIQTKVELCYCLDGHRKDFKMPGLPQEDGESPGEWLGIGTPGVLPLRVTGPEGKRNGGRGGYSGSILLVENLPQEENFHTGWQEEDYRLPPERQEPLLRQDMLVLTR
jgi:hypothetical protein